MKIKSKIYTLTMILALFGGHDAYAQQAIPITPALLDQMVQEGNYDLARQLLRAVTNNPIEHAVLEADIMRKEGNLSGAIEAYRQVLLANPNLDVVRFRLATALAENRQLDSARYHLQLLRDQTTDEELRQFFTDQLDAVKQSQPYGFSFNLGVTPSTNINGAGKPVVDKPTFFGGTYTTPDELKPHFGWRTNLGVNGYYRFRLADQHSLIARFGAASFRHTYPTIDYDTANVSLNYQYENARFNFEIGPFINKFWGDGKVYDTLNDEAVIGHRNENYTTTGYATSLNYILTPKSKVGLYANHSDIKYSNDYYDYKNGYTNSLSGSLTVFLNRETSLDFTAGGSRHREAGSNGDYSTHNGYTGRNLGISMTKLFENGLRLSTGADYAVRDYDGKYPALDEARHDKVYGYSFSIQNNKWEVGNFVPRLNCRFEDSHSNVDDYKIQDGSCGLSFSTEF